MPRHEVGSAERRVRAMGWRSGDVLRATALVTVPIKLRYVQGVVGDAADDVEVGEPASPAERSPAA